MCHKLCYQSHRTWTIKCGSSWKNVVNPESLDYSFHVSTWYVDW